MTCMLTLVWTAVLLSQVRMQVTQPLSDLLLAIMPHLLVLRDTLRQKSCRVEAQNYPNLSSVRWTTRSR